jgi:hypothetical protein
VPLAALRFECLRRGDTGRLSLAFSASAPFDQIQTLGQRVPIIVTFNVAGNGKELPVAVDFDLLDDVDVGHGFHLVGLIMSSYLSPSPVDCDHATRRNDAAAVGRKCRRDRLVRYGVFSQVKFVLLFFRCALPTAARFRRDLRDNLLPIGGEHCCTAHTRMAVLRNEIRSL